MAGCVEASAEAMRIVRTVRAHFASGPEQTGCAFLAAEGVLVTCAHLVTNEEGERADGIVVTRPDGERYDAQLLKVSGRHDLASLRCSESEPPPMTQDTLPRVGEQMVFSGMPQGVARPSVFPGMVSALGEGLLAQPRCKLIQIAGMVNNGNSGGPLLDAGSGAVVGVVTAKYVPLLQGIDQLANSLRAIPQFPSSVGIGEIDFAQFVNLSVRSMWQLSAVLRLVQVGTGWAVPAQYMGEVEVM